MDRGAAAGNGNDADPNKNLSSIPSSSSVASSLYEDPIEMEPRKSNVDAASLGLPTKQEKDVQSSSSSSSPRCEAKTQSADMAALMQSPPRQNMDQVDQDPAASPSAPAYRIPDYVFARNISTAPYEWSVASNESLFSIHPGNMSFTADQLSYKSGELGLPGEYPIHGSPADFQSNRPPTPSHKSMELATPKSENSHFGITEAAAAETMREVIRETEEEEEEEDPSKIIIKPAPAKDQLLSAAAPITPNSLGSHRSEDSMGSVKSFAFPVLPGVDKSNSSRPGAKSKQAAPASPGSPQVPLQQQPESEEAALKDSKEAPPANAPKKWCPCLPCCPF